ncbi:MAG: non-canonical purine NTP pyrophosphatase, RdgB/HAM1 family [Salinisphaeraceae bacterium]|jgi:XTP/dITP diphosphohydrolase|nr:non-canonical purine NTP pyrophosphatase, RdgB/HAM1 family [Salinisphaeraceae bacterium]
MATVVLASGNAGKLAELQQLLAPLSLTLVSQAERDVPEAAETGETFVENAILKARNAARHTGLPALADDSGLAVDALGGAPGVYSARYAGADADDGANNAKLLNALGDRPAAQRSARFHCAIVYLRSAGDPAPLICQADWAGVILDQARGDGGFGYDPLFWLPELGCSSAQLPREQKNRISHRGQAVAQLLERLRSGAR